MAYNKNYSEISSFPASSESLKQQFKEQLGFSITSISSQDVTEAISLFTNDLSALCQRAASQLIYLINLHIPTCKASLPIHSSSTKQVCLQLQFLPSAFPFSSMDSAQSSLLKLDQLTQHVSKQLQLATGLSKQLIYKHLSISAVKWEHCTVFVSMTVPVLLGCLAVRGYTFSPKWSNTAYEKLFKQALITTSYKHDKIDQRIQQLDSETSTGMKRNISSKLSLPLSSRGKMRLDAKHTKSLNLTQTPLFNSFDCTDKELSNFSKKNLTILQGDGTGSTYQNHQDGSNIALVGMMDMLGFSVRKEEMRLRQSLITTLSLQEDTKGLNFKLRFYQNSKSALPKRKVSSI